MKGFQFYKNPLGGALLLVTLMFCLVNDGKGQEVPAKMKIGTLTLHINENARDQIQQDVDRLTRSETYYQIIVDRMNLYFPFIERAHRAQDIPDEIKFLAIQESALISDAVSVSNAVGFWQFKDFTGREVGLRVDREVDERLNIVSASRGSARYFKTNNFFFDNWAYAVIAYQTGAYGAKNHTQEKNYGADKLTITTKTYWYLKKFIAHCVAYSPAIGMPHSEGLWLEEKIDAGGMSLQQIAEEEKVSLEELKTYNKWLKKGKVPQDKLYSVFVPRRTPKPDLIENAPKPKKQPIVKKSVKKAPIAEIKAEIIKSNKPVFIPINGVASLLAHRSDDIRSLSARAGISEKKFRKFNDLSTRDGILAGELYFVKRKKGRSSAGMHVLKPNQSLWSVAQQYGITLSSLLKMNRLSPTYKPGPGRVLWLHKTRPKDSPVDYYEWREEPKESTIKSTISKTSLEEAPSLIVEDTLQTLPEETKRETNIKPIKATQMDSSDELRKVSIHTVAKDQSLWSISQLYHVKLDDLLRWNDLPEPDDIYIGQNIRVKAPIQESSATKTILLHTVAPGETLYAISKQYDMTVDEIMELNEMSDFHVNEGQELRVYGE